jgi:hypothetical protein
MPESGSITSSSTVPRFSPVFEEIWVPFNLDACTLFFDDCLDELDEPEEPELDEPEAPDELEELESSAAKAGTCIARPRTATTARLFNVLHFINRNFVTSFGTIPLANGLTRDSSNLPCAMSTAQLGGKPQTGAQEPDVR